MRQVAMFRALKGACAAMWGVGFPIGRHDHEASHRVVTIRPGVPIGEDMLIPESEARGLFPKESQDRSRYSNCTLWVH